MSVDERIREIMPRYEERIHALPCWSGPIQLEILTGGLSNKNYLVTDSAGKHVVRFSVAFPFHHVARDRELMVARAAADAGFAPAIEHAEQGITVSRYLGAKTYDGDDVRANAPRVADLIRRFHNELPRRVSGPGYIFWVFHIIRDYGRRLVESRSRMENRIPGYLALADEMEAVQVPLPIIYGHNDLLPANLLDDGERLWLIDFEYAGFNTAMFDIAGLASNSGMGADESTGLMTAYFQSEPSAELVRAQSAMQCASLLREAMWSMISELHLDIDGVDYEAYTAENLARLDRAVESYRTTYGKI